MQEMLRLMLLGLLAGLWLSLEEVQCDGKDVASGDSASPLVFDTEVSTNENDKYCKNGKLLPVCDMSHCRHNVICNISDSAIKPIHISATAPNIGGVANKQCICKIKGMNGGKWRCCLCINNRCDTISDEDNLTATTIAMTTTTDTIVLTTTTYDSTIAAGGNGDSTSSMTQKPSDEKPPDNQKPSDTQEPSYQIILILLLFGVVAFIIVVVVLFIRKRKSDKRNDWSPVTYTAQGETVPNVYAGVLPDNEPSVGTAPPAGNHIYDELDMMTQDPTPSNVYSEVQPTSVAVDMGRSVDYVDIDLPMKDQQKPMSTSKVPLSLSPVYHQPFEPSASNTEYAEPFKPDTTDTATAPVLNHSSPAGDQQNDVYSLAKAIPLSDANVIYSQPNKSTKSTEPTGEAGGATDPIHLEAIEVKPGAGSGVVATQDPNAVYAEPMKPKKSS